MYIWLEKKNNESENVSILNGGLTNDNSTRNQAILSLLTNIDASNALCLGNCVCALPFFPPIVLNVGFKKVI